MNELKVFTSDEFGELNVVIKNNKEYVEAIPAAQILGYSNPRDAILRHCIKDGVVFHDMGVVTGKRVDNTEIIQYVKKKYIDEGNLYRLIVKSKLPSAIQFEQWIMEEVLPSIRKYGTYMDEDLLGKVKKDPEVLLEIIKKYKEARDQRVEMEKKAERLKTSIEVDKPYTELGKSISVCFDSITVGQYAKLLNNNHVTIGRNRLYSWLRESGYLIKRGKDKNTPKQVYIEQGIFKISENVVITSEGKKICTTTMITGKGQVYFFEKIIGEMINNF
ncbi:phage repressor protein/antirepressor Ant [Romboutsia weinsteinii]|uniref:Phage repressor protein/antirepressor Ant n=1 Tax=Romboutsia weinsteinii TaxID=2020949 RepID=A0A371J1Q5_9FIRM|nr:phage antirepressor KilAC domain-containing protein [Romboutsia weinsteinii]RDY26710.1 phage repressor protein/antirepressor Ant [Romboutsia weinsteinii]